MTTSIPDSGLFNLHGKVALVTGAGSGLGAAIARAMAQHGADLVLADRTAEQVRDTGNDCRALGRQVRTLGADLTRPDAAAALATQAQDAFGRLDVLVCNAGIPGPAGPLHAVDDDAWERVFQVNLRSVHGLVARLVPAMAARGGGSVILMASLSALRGNRAIGLYGMSKAALAQMARNLAVEWGPQGVRANAIAPGVIRTPLSSSMMADDAFMARRLAMTPLRRVGEPEEVAGVAVMLAAPAGAFITGQTLVVDGGTLISDGS